MNEQLLHIKNNKKELPSSDNKLKNNCNVKIPLSIILVRHGENIIDESIADSDLPLSELGKKEATWAKEKLSNCFDIAISSPSKRAKETAKIICDNMINYDSRLLEKGWGNNHNDGDEKEEDTEQRIKSLLRDIVLKYSDKKVLLITHGSLMKLIQDVIEGSKKERLLINNCTIIKYTRLNNDKIMTSYDKYIGHPFDEKLMKEKL